MQTIVVGLIAGTIYALLAAGITLVYKATRAVNFAQAEIGTLAIYTTWWVSGKHGQPWWLGALAALGVGIVLALLFERLVMRQLVTSSQITKTVATIGLLGLLTGLEARWFAGSAKIFPPPISIKHHITVAGVVVSGTQILAVIVVAVIALALTLFLRFTRFGLAILASADDPVAAQLMGVPRARVSAVTWAIAGALSVIACLLIEPTVGVLSPGFASTLFIYGLTAALLGGLTSLTGAFVGGLLVGIAQAEVQTHLLYPQVPGPENLAMLVIVLAVLLARPQGLFGAREA